MKKPKNQRRPLRAAAFEVRIITIDETPIRDAVLREHHRLEEQASEVRTRIDRFESADLPAYTRWEARVLGPLLTAIREAETDLNKKRAILEAVEDEMFFNGCSRLAAYKRVMRQLDDPEPNDFDDFFGQEAHSTRPEPEPDPATDFGLPQGFDADDFDNMTPAQQAQFRREYEFMAQMYESVTGMPAPDLDELLRASRRGAREEARSHKAGAPPKSHTRATQSREAERDRASSRIKELYRLLVRKLHPDLNPDQSSRDRELWHSVQEAYNKRDVEALEAAAARVEIRLNGQAGHLAVSLLRRLVSDLKKSLMALKTRLSGVRKHPAFDFAARHSESLEKFEAKHRKELERKLRGLQVYLADLTAALDDLAARAAKPKKKRATRVKVF